MTRSTATSRFTAAILFTLAVAAGPYSLAGQDYWPGTHLDWERRDPAAAGFDPIKLGEAIQFAISAESTSPRDLTLNHDMSFGREPRGEAIGPFTVRAPQSGVILHKGYIVAEWGDPEKVDNTFSVAKSFLSATVGLAWDLSLIHI